jgi:hypothetical protein
MKKIGKDSKSRIFKTSNADANDDRKDSIRNCIILLKKIYIHFAT